MNGSSKTKANGKSTGGINRWVGLIPFILFCLAFEFVPIAILIRDSFTLKAGGLTLQHYQSAFEPTYLNGFWNSIRLSLATALIATLLGTLIGYQIYRWPNKKVQNILITLSDVTTNFAGAPLAFGFIIILGSSGVITKFLFNTFNWKIYPQFSIYSFTGLVLTYVYFQLPLMVLLIIPAFSGLRKEWAEAAENLGASRFEYWTKVAIPVLQPSIIAGFMLLFANAFGAYATAFTLTGLRLPLITMQIGSAISGEVMREQGHGQALAVISLLIMGICIGIYQISTNKARSLTNR